MTGIPLAYLSDDQIVGAYSDADARGTTHIARPVPEDEAREAVIGRARKLVRLADPSADDISALARDIAALDALDAS